MVTLGESHAFGFCIGTQGSTHIIHKKDGVGCHLVHNNYNQSMNYNAANHPNYVQAGIALGPVLFIIAVLAILAAAIAAGSGGFSANTSTEKDKAMAQAIIAYADQVQAATDFVRAQCDDTQISFQSPGQKNQVYYINPNSPTDNSCNVFSPSGGGLVWQAFPPQAAINSTALAAFNINYSNQVDPYMICSTNFITGIGTGTSSSGTFPITLLLGTITQSVCAQINYALTGSTTIPSNQWAVSASQGWVGTFKLGGSGGGGIRLTPTGQSKLCFYDSTTPSYPYWFYYMLVAK